MSWRDILPPEPELKKIKKFPPVNQDKVSQISQFLVNTESIKEVFEERAAILEYEASLPKREAERLAYQEALYHYVIECYPHIEAAFHDLLYKPLNR